MSITGSVCEAILNASIRSWRIFYAALPVTAPVIEKSGSHVPSLRTIHSLTLPTACRLFSVSPHSSQNEKLKLQFSQQCTLSNAARMCGERL